MTTNELLKTLCEEFGAQHEESLNQYIEEFNESAENNLLSKEQFLKYSKRDGMDDQVAERIFTFFDANKDGSMDLREFISANLMIDHGDTNEQTKFFFTIFDLNGDGTIDKQELKLVMKALGVTELTEEELDAIFEDLDEDKNGLLDVSSY
ncbi:hypothetical protein ABK040_013872 [Willaertia magna]